MAFEIVFGENAEAQMKALPARERKTLYAGIFARLSHQPTVLTKAIKKLRPNPVAEYQLSVGDLRVLYNVEEDRVVVVVIGRKVGDQLFVEGEAYREHQDYPPEPSGNGLAGDLE
jgi:mRNA interferase RelE/StbE